jgi:hypothetical protein
LGTKKTVGHGPFDLISFFPIFFSLFRPSTFGIQVRYAASGESVHAQKDIKAIMRSLGVDLQGPSSFLGFGLSNTFHITILHGQFKDSVEKAYETSPLFYQGVSKSTATTLEMAAEEVMQV